MGKGPKKGVKRGPYKSKSEDYIVPWSEVIDETEEGLKQLYRLKMGKLWIINNKFVTFNMNSQFYMEKLKEQHSFKIEDERLQKSLEEDQFQLEVINGFESRKEGEQYYKDNLKHLPFIRTIYREDLGNYYKCLVQMHPETKEVLVVYKGVSLFAQHNNINEGMLYRMGEKGKLLGGYPIKTLPEYEYAPTTDDLMFQDPLNLNIPLPKPKTIYAKQAKQPKPPKGEHKKKAVVQMDKQGNVIAEYESIKAAKQATGASAVCEVCNGKQYTSGGYFWKYKKDIICKP